MFHLIENARRMNSAKIPSALKYLLVSFHDTNLSNILRFLLFFDTYGYDKFVMFSSSLRFELMRDILDESEDSYYMRIVFDNVELKLPFCKDTYCTYDEYVKHFQTNLVLQYEEIEAYCAGEMGGEFDFDISYKK
jgi:hypothetical protein